MAKTRSSVSDLPRVRTKEQEGKLISAMYDRSTRLLLQLAESGVSHPGLGFVGSLGLFELMHGGAYAAPVNQLPYFAENPESSPYWAGDLQNVNVGGLFDDLFKLFGGSPNAAELYKEMVTDANVPHVLPKLISDETYALFLQTYVKFTSGELFGVVGTGVQTWVGAATDIIGTGKERLAAGTASEQAQLTAETARLKSTQQAARGALARSDSAARQVSS